MAESDSTTLTDTSATSDSITNDSSDNNDYAEDSLSPSSSFSPIEESDHDYDGAIEPYMFEPIASDSSNSTDEDLSQDKERLHNTNLLVVILLVRCGIVRWLHS